MKLIKNTIFITTIMLLTFMSFSSAVNSDDTDIQQTILSFDNIEVKDYDVIDLFFSNEISPWTEDFMILKCPEQWCDKISRDDKEVEILDKNFDWKKIELKLWELLESHKKYIIYVLYIEDIDGNNITTWIDSAKEFVVPEITYNIVEWEEIDMNSATEEVSTEEETDMNSATEEVSTEEETDMNSDDEEVSTEEETDMNSDDEEESTEEETDMNSATEEESTEEEADMNSDDAVNNADNLPDTWTKEFLLILLALLTTTWLFFIKRKA